MFVRFEFNHKRVKLIGKSKKNLNRIIMFVGELEFSDIPINHESYLAPLAYVYFLTFVFLIVVVLMNLLNGLAVSDTGIIREKAEIYSYRQV